MFRVTLLILLLACSKEKSDKAPEPPAQVPGAWRDPVTGKNWILAGARSVWDGAPKICGSWRLPEATEIRDAVYRGLLRGFSLPQMTNADYAWAKSDDPSSGMADAVVVSQTTGTPGRIVQVQKNSMNYVYCCDR